MHHNPCPSPAVMWPYIMSLNWNDTWRINTFLSNWTRKIGLDLRVKLMQNTMLVTDCLVFFFIQVLMGDYSTEFRQVDNPLEHVGYCPQVNPLWPRITLQEHLEIYAAIKGLRGQDVPGIITRWVELHSDRRFNQHHHNKCCTFFFCWNNSIQDVKVADGCFVTVVSVVNALELKDHLDKQAKTLSAGLKRKVRTRSPQWRVWTHSAGHSVTDMQRFIEWFFVALTSSTFCQTATVGINSKTFSNEFDWSPEGFF